MRIAIFGQAAFGVDTFNALHEAGEQIVGVSTPRTPEGGRPDPLRAAAEEAGLPWLETRALRREEAFEAYRAWEPELIVFAFVTDIVRKNVLDAAPHGAIQYHPSLLPKYRGRSALNWPVVNGDRETGLTIFWVDEGIDTGPILLQRTVEIRPGDTMGSLYFERLYPLGIEALAEATALVREGRAPRIKQDHSQATYEPPFEDEHALVDWSRPARAVFNHVRGCDPAPGAIAALGDARVRLFDPSLAPAAPSEPIGTVLEPDAANPGAARIAVIGGVLTVGRVRADGGKVAASEALSPGDRLTAATLDA